MVFEPTRSIVDKRSCAITSNGNSRQRLLFVQLWQMKETFRAVVCQSGKSITAACSCQIAGEFFKMSFIPHVARDTEVFQKCGRATGRPKLMPLPGPLVW